MKVKTVGEVFECKICGNVVQVVNLAQTMERLRARDVWMVGLDLGADALRFDQADLRGALGLVVGSEGSGLRRLVLPAYAGPCCQPERGHGGQHSALCCLAGAGFRRSAIGSCDPPTGNVEHTVRGCGSVAGPARSLCPSFI